MIRFVTLSNFRGFERLRVGPLERVSLILGRNNVGKTSLLEALFLLSGPTNPELPLRLSGLRGVMQFRNDAEEMWGWLFHRKKSKQTIELVADLPAGRSRTLTLSMSETRTVRFKPKNANKPKPQRVTASTEEQLNELQMYYRSEEGKSYRTAALVRDTSLEFRRDEPLRLPTCIFITGRSGYTEENAERFSRLEEVGKEGDLIPPLRVLEPRLKRLAVLVTASGPVIHGDLGLGHMVPIHFMGEGIGRLLTILLAMASCPKGLALVDEIEMGLHYSAMVEAWRAIGELARQYDVQVVATTHNHECIRAGHEVFSEQNPSNFCVHRLERVGELIEATEFTTGMMETALAAGLEVR